MSLKIRFFAMICTTMQLEQLCTFFKKIEYRVEITTYALPNARNVYHDKHFTAELAKICIGRT